MGTIATGTISTGLAFRWSYDGELNQPILKTVLSDYFGFDAAIATCADSGYREFPITHYRNQHFLTHLMTTASLRYLAELGNFAAARETSIQKVLDGRSKRGRRVGQTNSTSKILHPM